MKKIIRFIIFNLFILIGFGFFGGRAYAVGFDNDSDGLTSGDTYFDERFVYYYDEDVFLISGDEKYKTTEISSVKLAGKTIDSKYIKNEDDCIMISKEAFSKLSAGSYEMDVVYNNNDVYRVQVILIKTPEKRASNRESKFLGTFFYDAKNYPDYYEFKLDAKGYSSYYLMSISNGWTSLKEYTYDGKTLRIYSKEYGGKISGYFELNCDFNADDSVTYSFYVIEKSQKHPNAEIVVYSEKTVYVGNKYQLLSGASKLKSINTSYITTDSSIATISDKGLVTVLKEGKVYISAFIYFKDRWIEHKILLTAKKGTTKNKTFTLSKLTMEDNIPTISMSKDLSVGKKMQIFKDSYGMKNTISDKNVVSVNKNGYIVGKSKGKATVTTLVNPETIDYETYEYKKIKLAKFVFNITIE